MAAKRKRVKRRRGPHRNKPVRRLKLRGIGYRSSAGGGSGGRDSAPSDYTGPAGTKPPKVKKPRPTSPDYTGPAGTKGGGKGGKKDKDVVAHGSATRWKDEKDSQSETTTTTTTTTTTISTTTTLGGVWTSHFDNNDWAVSNGIWNGSGWEAEDQGPGGYVLVLTTIGTWADGYRPTKVRFTASENPLNGLVLFDSESGYPNGNRITNEIPATSGEEYDCAFTTFDLDALNMSIMVPWTLTNMEFLE